MSAALKREAMICIISVQIYKYVNTYWNIKITPIKILVTPFAHYSLHFNYFRVKKKQTPIRNEAVPRWSRVRLTTPAIWHNKNTNEIRSARSPHRRITILEKDGIIKMFRKSFHQFMEGADHRRTMSYGTKRIFTYLRHIPPPNVWYYIRA